jgi:hypothetical protein
MISRRKFLAMAVGLMGGWIPSWPRFALGSLFPHFFFAQLKYRGGEWDPNPLFAEAFVEELELRTSIDARKERRVMQLSDRDLFFCPLLYMAGRYEFEPFTQQDREVLRRFLTYGGFLFAEDTVGAKGFGFDQAFRREMRAVLPGYELKRLSSEHSVYQSFYLMGSFGGRQRVNPYLEGITIPRLSIHKTTCPVHGRGTDSESGFTLAFPEVSRKGKQLLKWGSISLFTP